MLDPVIESAVKLYHERTSQAFACAEDLEICRTILPEDTYYWLDNEINSSATFKSIDEVKDILREFAKVGIMIYHFHKSESNPAWTLQGKKVRIRLNPHWLVGDEAKAQGASCRLVLVDTQMIESKKYKLICDDKDLEDYYHDTVIRTEE